MAIEAEYREEVHRQLVEECGIAFLQTAPIACGGISRVRELSKLTRETPTQLSLEISSTAIALMAACQIAAADNAIAHVEYHYLHRVFFDDLTLEVQPDHSDHFSLSNCPGLGISLPIKDIVAEFEMADSSKARSPQIAVH